MRRRGVQRLEVEGWGDGVIVLESMQIRCPPKNGRAAFSDFSTLRPVFKKARFQAMCLLDPVGSFSQKSVLVWTAPKTTQNNGPYLYGISNMGEVRCLHRARR